MLSVTLISYDPSADPSFSQSEPIEADYVSLYNGGTHGPPALIAPGRVQGENQRPLARPGDEVLYINTAIVPGFTAKRFDDLR